MADGWQETICVCGAADATILFEVATTGAPLSRTRIERCSSCGLHRLNPRPDAETLRNYYDAGYYSYAGRRRSPRKQALWEFLRDVAAGVPRRSTRRLPRLVRDAAASIFDVNVPLGGHSVHRVIDVGCGYGDLLIYLRSRGCAVLGVEYDAAAAAKGREYGLDIHVGEISGLNLSTASVDAAVLQHSLEHVPDPEALVAELARIVRPGGTLHIAVPNGNAAGLFGEREAWGSLSNPEHFWYFDVKTLGALVTRNGFIPSEFSFKTLWRDHWRLVRTEWRSAGAVPALRRIGRFISALVRSRGRGDILRLVARRTPRILGAES